VPPLCAAAEALPPLEPTRERGWWPGPAIELGKSDGWFGRSSRTKQRPFCVGVARGNACSAVFQGCCSAGENCVGQSLQERCWLGARDQCFLAPPHSPESLISPETSVDTCCVRHKAGALSW
jgi:hypothetical protein